MLNTNEKYVFGRSQKESKRLDAQHDLLVKATKNTLVHPSILKENIFSVADIATGTGIWLRDTSQLLAKTNGTKGYYHGFDISPDQFPMEMDGVQFSVHDITTTFPKEHWNRYDLVHVRLLIAGLEESDYRAAISNIQQILSMFFRVPVNAQIYALIVCVHVLLPSLMLSEPGGYLQWEEIDEETYMIEDNPVFWEIWRCFDFSFKAEGKCFQASAKIFEECSAVGYTNIERICYSSDWNNNLRTDTEERFVAIIETLYASLLLRSGQVDNEQAARKQTEELIEKYRYLCKKGVSPPVKLMRVVAQRKMSN